MEATAPPPPELFVTLGVLDSEKLKRCLEFQPPFQNKALHLPSAHATPTLGRPNPNRVPRFRAPPPAPPLPGRGSPGPFPLPASQANRRYKCEPCMMYLEAVVDEAL